MWRNYEYCRLDGQTAHEDRQVGSSGTTGVWRGPLGTNGLLGTVGNQCGPAWSVGDHCGAVQSIEDHYFSVVCLNHSGPEWSIGCQCEPLGTIGNRWSSSVAACKLIDENQRSFMRRFCDEFTVSESRLLTYAASNRVSNVLRLTVCMVWWRAPGVGRRDVVVVVVVVSAAGCTCLVVDVDRHLQRAGQHQVRLHAVDARRRARHQPRVRRHRRPLRLRLEPAGRPAGDGQW